MVKILVLCFPSVDWSNPEFQALGNRRVLREVINIPTATKAAAFYVFKIFYQYFIKRASPLTFSAHDLFTSEAGESLAAVPEQNSHPFYLGATMATITRLINSSKVKFLDY